MARRASPRPTPPHESLRDRLEPRTDHGVPGRRLAGPGRRPQEAVLLAAGGPRKAYLSTEGLDAWKARPEGGPPAVPWQAGLAEALAKLEGEISIFWADSVVAEMDDAHFPFAQDPRFKSHLYPYLPTANHDVARPPLDKFAPDLDASPRP